MSSTRRNFFLVLALLSLALLAATAWATTAWAAERAPMQPAAGFTPRYSVAKQMVLEATLEGPQVVDPATGRIYAIADYRSRLSVIATRPALTETPVDLPFRGGIMALSPDGQRLYVLEDTENEAREGRIAVLNTTTLTFVDTFLFTCPEVVSYGNCRGSAAAVGPGNRLYVLLSGSAIIDIHDVTTGDRLLRFTHPGVGPSALAVHGSSLYTVTTNLSTLKSVVRRFDISALTPVIGPSRELAGYNYASIQVAPDGSFLILHEDVRDGIALQLDADSLSTIHNYDVAGEAYYGKVIISSDSSEVVMRWGYPPDEARHDIEAHDAVSGALVRIGYPLNHPDYYYESGFLPLPNNRVAHLFTNSILVLQPNDYIAAAPVVLSGFCGGPFVDTFSDPNSGWPVADLGPVAYRYDREQYSILQRQNNRWSAVSRGDVWNNWQGVGIRTWVVEGEGMSGLVFGLNADWSQFYTLEVIPHLSRWVVFAYSNTTGWQILATGLGTNGVNQSNSLVLNLSEDGALGLLVNDQLVYSLASPPPGRIGLSGGSFESGGEIDLRFDDYMLLTGPNCFHSGGRANTVERSPVIERPPLEEFLELRVTSDE